jgi:hypothetical protein
MSCLSMARALSVLWVVLGLAVTVPARAGLVVRPGLELGARMTTLEYDEEHPFANWEVGWRGSGSIGLMLDASRGGRWGVLTGVRLQQDGDRVEYDTGPGAIRASGEFQVVASTLVVPVQVRFAPDPRRGPRFVLGPEIAVPVAARLIDDQIQQGTWIDHVSAHDEIIGQLRRVTLAAGLSAGWAFPVENHTALVELRGSLGLTGAADEDDWITDWTNRGVGIAVGLLW